MTLEKIPSWQSQADLCTRAFEEVFASLSPAQFNWRPSAEGWSMAQHLDHLIAVNHTYFSAVEAVRSGEFSLPWWGRIGLVVGNMGRLVLQSVQASNKKKLRTYPIWEPAAGPFSADVVERFRESQGELVVWLGSIGDLLEQGQVITSPASRRIVYRLETAVEIILAHAERHLAQVEALAGNLPSG